MSLLPQLLSIQKEANAASLHLLVSKDLGYFRGHFPGQPLLPGVVQVDWAIRFAREHLDVPADGFVALTSLKFSAPVLPDTRLELVLRWKPEANRMEFIYSAGARKYASGQAMFSGTT
jgi:3-hydroxyacyl-[acyl-carrier-protein] dehydratase